MSLKPLSQARRAAAGWANARSAELHAWGVRPTSDRRYKHPADTRLVEDLRKVQVVLGLRPTGIADRVTLERIRCHMATNTQLGRALALNLEFRPIGPGEPGRIDTSCTSTAARDLAIARQKEIDARIARRKAEKKAPKPKPVVGGGFWRVAMARFKAAAARRRAAARKEASRKAGQSLAMTRIQLPAFKPLFVQAPKRVCVCGESRQAILRQLELAFVR